MQKNLEEILTVLKEVIAEETGKPPNEIDEDATFYSLGLDSISSVFVLEEAESKLGIRMNPIYFWDYPTTRKLAVHLWEAKRNQDTPPASS